MIEFKQNGKTFIYDFNKLCGSQIIMAEQAFVIAGQKLKKEPNNLTEMESIISHTSLFKAFGILLLELDVNGSVIPFDEGEQKGIKFLKEMNAENLVKVYNGNPDDKESEGIQKDFFIKLGRPSPESQRLYKDSMELVNLQKSGLGLNLKDTTKAVQDLLKTVKEKKDSLIKEKPKTE